MLNSLDLKSLLEIIVAGSAIVALILSIISILQSSRYKKDERHSKRAYIAPVSEPGYLKLNNLDGNTNPLFVSLQNYGQNPASNVTIELLGVGIESTKDANENFVIVFDIINTVFNPTPFNANIFIDYSLSKLNEVNVSESQLLITHYIIALVEYSDQIIDKHYKDVFCWDIADDGRLCELIEEDYRKLKEQEFIKKFFHT